MSPEHRNLHLKHWEYCSYIKPVGGSLVPAVLELMVDRFDRITFTSSFNLDPPAFGKLIIVSSNSGFTLGA